MKKELTGRYDTAITGGVLVFRTRHFSSARGSLLHGDIYSRELASALSAFALAGIVYVWLAKSFSKGLIAHAVVLTVFTGGFLAFRSLLFRERFLETVFNLPKGTVEFFFVGLRKKTDGVLFLKDVRKIVIETERSDALAPDGAEVVKKISAQHGMAMPDLGRERVLYLLTLKSADGAGRIIYADTELKDVLAAHEEITKFLENTEERGSFA